MKRLLMAPVPRQAYLITQSTAAVLLYNRRKAEIKNVDQRSRF